MGAYGQQKFLWATKIFVAHRRPVPKLPFQMAKFKRPRVLAGTLVRLDHVEKCLEW